MIDNGQEVFEFERGSFFGGDLRYVIYQAENKFIMESFGFNGFAGMGCFNYEIPEYEIDVLYEVLKPVMHWKKNYECEEEILDGYGWTISYKYHDREIKSGGYMKYPKDYKKVVRKIQKQMEYLGKKYNPQYEELGLEMRLKL